MPSLAEGWSNSAAPGSNEFAKRKSARYAARLARRSVAIHLQLEHALRDAMRIAFAEARLVYVESDHTNFVYASVTKVLAAALASESETDIVTAIEESFSLAIDARLRQLDEPLSPDE